METVVEKAAKSNLARFMEATGQSEQAYYAWASQVGQRMHINRLDSLVCARLGMYTVAHLVYRPTVLPEGISPSEVDEYLLDHSQNPYELAKLWQAASANAAHWVDVESVLAEHLRPFRKEDFETHGDPNHLPDVSRAWFKKDGINLDVQLIEINALASLGQPIGLQDAIDFVRKYRPGQYKNPAQQQVERLESRFRELTTFRIKEYYVQHLIRMCDLELGTIEHVPF